MLLLEPYVWLGQWSEFGLGRGLGWLWGRVDSKLTELCSGAIRFSSPKVSSRRRSRFATYLYKCTSVSCVGCVLKWLDQVCAIKWLAGHLSQKRPIMCLGCYILLWHTDCYHWAGVQRYSDCQLFVIHREYSAATSCVVSTEISASAAGVMSHLTGHWQLFPPLDWSRINESLV